MKKIVKRSLIGLSILAVIGYVGVSYGLAKSIVRPTVLSLEEEKNWIQDHGLLGNFDNYEKEDYIIKGYQDYTINAQFLKNPDSNSNKYVIITHGFRSNRNGSIKYVDVYRNMGYNVIIYDVRGHGLNERTTVTLGQLESEDLYFIIQDTYKRFGDNISLGLHGESMGSATSLSVLSKSQKLDFVVADCGFSNLYDLIQSGYKDNGVRFLIGGVSTITNIFYDVDMKKTSPIDSLKDNKVPILFIHGKEDSFIKPENSQAMFDYNMSVDEIHLIDNAAHAESREKAGLDVYSKIINNFLTKI